MSEMAIDFKRRPISVRVYHLMAEAGVFAPDERVELIEGELIVPPPMGRPHRSAINRLNRLLTSRFNGRAVVQVQCSVILDDYSEPEPDFVLLLEDATGYLHTDPGPAHMLLAIEVGDTSRRFDRRVKVPLYARTGVPEVWLVDVVEQAVFIYCDLANGAYATTRVARRGEQIACTAFPGDALPVDEILAAREETERER
jgi:Uma2 family endonuclease